MRPISVRLATNLIVFAGLALGDGFLKPSDSRGFVSDPRAGSFANWDGQWYGAIATAGYTYSTTEYSSATFFPLYPLLGRTVAAVTGWPIPLALFAVANGCWLAALWVLDRDLAARPGFGADAAPGYTLLALACAPTAIFFRVAYSESLFLLLVVLFLHGLRSGWPAVVVAVVVGLATATRPVGVALIPPLAWYAWEAGGSWVGKVARVAAAVAVGLLGIGGYATFLAGRFGDPLAFVHAQAAWDLRPPTTWPAKVLALATLEPIRACLDPGSAAYLGGEDCRRMGLFNPRPYDVGFFLGAVALTTLGAARRWLDRREALTGACLLLVPYLANGYARQMGSMGRFAVVAVPAWLVAGRLLGRASPLVAAGILAGGACGLFTASALFAAWYPIL